MQLTLVSLTTRAAQIKRQSCRFHNSNRFDKFSPRSRLLNSHALIAANPVGVVLLTVRLHIDGFTAGAPDNSGKLFNELEEIARQCRRHSLYLTDQERLMPA